MIEALYFITVNNVTVAQRLSLEYALLFAKAIFQEFYNDHDMVVAICEMERTSEVCEK